MYPKKLLWLLCANILVSQAIFAQNLPILEPNEQGKQPAQTKHFTLNEAIAIALKQSPRLQAANSGVAAAKAARNQAGLWQNPEVRYSADNVGGGSAYRAINPPQFTYSVSQLVEVGGKITARRQIANQGVEIASRESDSAKLDVIRDVTIAYADIVAAEEHVHLATNQKNLAEDVLKSVNLRVGAAAAPLMQKSRAEVELYSANITLNKAEHEVHLARKKLAILMGQSNFAQPLDKQSFYDIAKPEIAMLEQKLKNNPDLVKLDNNLQQSKAMVELEKANAIPDPRFNLEVIDLPSANDQALLLAVSLPIPVFNSNRDNISKARHQLNRTQMDNRQLENNANIELNQACELMEDSHMRVQTIKAQIIPSAKKAFQLARTGYDLGRFSYLEVLDAQRSLFGVKLQQIDALREFHIAKAQVERLTATSTPPSPTFGE